MRILLDSNVLISAAITEHGSSAQLVDLWLDDRFELVTSPAQLAELSRALDYEHVRARLRPDRARALLENLAVAATLVDPAPGPGVSPDPDDDVILSAAIAGVVDLIVWGDKKGMLDLREVDGIPIVTPAEALSRLGGS